MKLKTRETYKQAVGQNSIVIAVNHSLITHFSVTNHSLSKLEMVVERNTLSILDFSSVCLLS